MDGPLTICCVQILAIKPDIAQYNTSLTNVVTLRFVCPYAIILGLHSFIYAAGAYDYLTGVKHS